KPLRRSIYHSFVGRSEFIWSQRQQFPREQRAFGWYASGDYQFARRWFAGGRFDWSDRSQFDFLTDKGAAATLTYLPSEFSQIREEYRFTKKAEEKERNELLMQLIFSRGAHGAHPLKGETNKTILNSGAAAVAACCTSKKTKRDHRHYRHGGTDAGSRRR